MSQAEAPTTRRAIVRGADPVVLAGELAHQLDAPNAAAVVIFPSPNLHRDAIAPAQRASRLDVVACLRGDLE